MTIIAISSSLRTLFKHLQNQYIIEVGDYAPNFSVETLQGERVELKDYRGKGVFLNFWGRLSKYTN
ncbi:redoxin domain-containing protein [Virgibacillus sp. FSP13]